MENQNKIPCSVAMLTLNCRDDLKRCLESLRDFEEIVILDGNSTDGTPELARQYGAMIYPQVETEEKNIRIKDFTTMRLKSFVHTTKDWIFEIDADETIDTELSQEIRNLIREENNNTAVMIPRLAIVNGKIIRHAFFYPDQFIRVWHKNSGITYRAGKEVHEKIFIPDGVEVKFCRGSTRAPWPSYEECLKKDNQYLEIALQNADKFTRRKIFRKAWINIGKGVYIGLKSLKIYAKHGFKDSLPPKYVWRFMRYHFLISLGLIKKKINKF